MPEHEGTTSNYTRGSRRQILYSCQYDQLLYRRQYLSEHQMAASSSLWGQHNLDSRSSSYFDRNITSCHYVEVLSSRNRHLATQDALENKQEGRNRKLRRRRYRMMSNLGDRNFRYKQRFSFLTSDQSRRKRFPTIAQRKAANIREQKRMYNLKEAFKTLRECLPTFSYEKKMSRIETLRLAIAYITFLRKLLNDRDPDSLARISKNPSETGREC